jgi:hypothetical protein
MALAYDNSTDGASALTFSHTTAGSNRILFVACASQSNGSDSVTGVTYNSVSMTLVNKIQVPSSRFIYLFVLVNPSSGSNSVQISLNTGSGTTLSAASSYTGAKQTGQPDNSTTNTVTSSSSITTSLTTVASNCWTVCVFGNQGIQSMSGSGITNIRLTGSGTNGAYGIADSNSAVSGSTSLGFTVSSTNIGMVMASMAPVPPPVTARGTFLFTML